MRKPTNRAYHLIDIENLAGRHHEHPGALQVASAVYRREVCIAANDLVVVGCDTAPMHRLQIGLLWPGARIVAGSGHNGADKALQREIDTAWLAARFDRVVIGSGDGGFTPLARSLADAGLRVLVAARITDCAPSLYRSAHEVVALFEPAHAA